MRAIGTAMGFTLAALLALAPSGATAQVAVPEAATLALEPVAMRVVGRADAVAEGLARQWPGTYFETAFTGDRLWFRHGGGKVAYRIHVDDAPPTLLVQPAPGLYRIDATGTGTHRVRIAVISENQDAPTVFGGFFGTRGMRAVPLPPRATQIELIGDSHSVGYGNMSPSRECDDDAVWATTDTHAGIGGILAARYDADVQVNAISGRGVVRNYGGFPGDTLPEAYPFTLFDKAERARDAGWQPDLIVVSLGTNDFSTELKDGERWPDRAALHADFEARYAAFIQDLRRANPEAFFVLWATDMAQGEIAAEGARVVDRLKAAGETRIAFVPVKGLTMAGCNFHPSAADDRAIADAVAGAVDFDRPDPINP